MPDMLDCFLFWLANDLNVRKLAIAIVAIFAVTFWWSFYEAGIEGSHGRR